MENTSQADEETNRLAIEIVRLLKKYQAYDSNGPLRLRRIGKDYDGGYIIPEIALEQADVIMGYGINDDSSFEEEASSIYGKRSYGFDGSVALKKITHKLFHFSPIYLIKHGVRAENITNFSSFQDHLEIFHLQGKKLFIKMDIEGNEYTSMPDVLEHSSYITGITFEIHFFEEDQLPLALHLLQQMQKDFILVHVHGHNYCSRFIMNQVSEIPRIIELSYVNKQLIQHAHLAEDQKHPTALDMPIDPSRPEIFFEIGLNL
ncbi:MAG: hypothetical protein Q8L68_01430 [Methylococcales bacterium]|nr:hypothetical protein [Methylococcales bacterium]